MDRCENCIHERICKLWSDQECRNASCFCDDCFEPKEKEKAVAHWIVRHDGPYMRVRVYCSACGKRSGIGGTLENQLKPFCPNCGFPMSEDVRYE